MFVGIKEIKMVNEKDEKNVVLEFNDEPSITINKELFDLIKTEEKGKGEVTDNVNHYFARKFLAELAYYGLNHRFARSVSLHLETLSHNLREELICKTFGCIDSDDIVLIKLLDKPV